jgi:hypothetical protein
MYLKVVVLVFFYNYELQLNHLWRRRVCGCRNIRHPDYTERLGLHELFIWDESCYFPQISKMRVLSAGDVSNYVSSLVFEPSIPGET